VSSVWLRTDGPMPKLKSFRAAGHFYSGMYEFDSKLAYVALAEAQKFLGMPGARSRASTCGRRTPTAAPETALRIARLLGPLRGSLVGRSQPGLFMALRLEKLAMFVVLTFIALVASFSIISTSS
jgi:lipoprotein-releasing system permease protein